MSNVTILSAGPSDFVAWLNDFAQAGGFSLSNTSSTSTTVKNADGDTFVLNGTDFQSFLGVPFSGTVTSAQLTRQGGDQVSFDQFSVTLPKLYQASRTSGQAVIDLFGNVTFTGSGSGDAAILSKGDDFLEGKGGNDVLNGGDGNDTAIFSGAHADYSVLRQADGSFQVTGFGEIDTLTGIEKLKFDDGIFDVEAPSNSAPVVSEPIADASVAEDANFSLVLPAGTFSDADGDALTVSATEVSGDALPSWLKFDAGTQTFTGNPPANFNGSLDVKVTATDAGQMSASDTFKFTVTPVNDAPEITSGGGKVSSMLSLAENKKGVAAFKATDIEGDKLVWSLDGGKDAELFSVDSKTGALSFKAAPDFEAPVDAGKNNIYEVVVRVSDGKLTDTQAVAVKVTNVVGATRKGDDKANTLVGTSEEDTLKGGKGADKLTGGLGADKLYAGADKDTDTFVFAKGDSGKTAATWDQLFDFRADTDNKPGKHQAGADLIDFHLIDADGAKGDQALRFVSKFTTAGKNEADGQVRVVDAGSHVNVEVDWNGDKQTDLVLQVMNTAKLTADDFLL